MIVNEVVELFRESLKRIYKEGELTQIIYLVFEQVNSFSKIDLILKRSELITVEEEEKFKSILSELEKHKPVQYVLGYAWFYGMSIKVNENVLIPRQETEELIDWIIKETRDEGRGTGEVLNILDVCTGSGCIAISLKKNLTKAKVTALDISEQALDVARENSQTHDTEIQFVETDILQQKTSPFTLHHSFNIIVSNPPYVLESEKQQMKKKELDYEPHLAFFVKDQDPLLFYKSISEFAQFYLSAGGRLYFEINEMKGNEIVELLTRQGFSDVCLKKDLNGKDRMVRAVFNGRSKNQEPGTLNQEL